MEKTIKDLPEEILFHIIVFLDWPSIPRLCQTSTYLNERMCVLARELRDIKKYPVLKQLRVALERNQLDIVKLLVRDEPEQHRPGELLKYKNRVWCMDVLKLFPDALSFAINVGMSEWSEKLIKDGMDVNRGNKFGRTPIWVAARAGFLPHSFITSVTDVNKADNGRKNSFWTTIYKGNIEIMSKLIAAGADVNKADNRGRTPLWIAVHEGRIEIVSKLIAAGADVNKSDNRERSPLWIAVHDERIEIVSKLITAGADVNKANKYEETPLLSAVERRYTDIVDKLIAAGADVNKATPLLSAAFEGHTEVVDKLIAAGADVNKADNNGETPLWIATRWGRSGVVNKLIAAGAK